MSHVCCAMTKSESTTMIKTTWDQWLSKC